MKKNRFSKVLIAIIKKLKSFTLIMFIGMIVITFFPSIIEIFVDCVFFEANFKEITLVELEEIAVLWKKHYLVFVTPILADILVILGRYRFLRIEDFINKKIIYRDIIKNNSAIALAYTDTFKEDLYKYIVITLLALQLKGKILLKDDDIVVIDKEIKLRKSEQFILNNIKSGKLVIKETKEFLGLAKKEAAEDNLILDCEELKKNSYKVNANKIKTFIIFLVAFIFGLNVLIEIFPNVGEEYLKVWGWVICFFSVTLFTIKIFIEAIVNMISAEKSVRTELGIDVNIKLEGLKNYIKNYSFLNKRKKEELDLWEEYLIYSVMFDQNKKILEDVKKLIIVDNNEVKED